MTVTGTETLTRLRALTESLTNPELLSRLVEALPDALVITNEEGTIILFNAQAELLFGYHRSEVLGHPVEMLIPVELREAHVGHRTGFVDKPRTRPMGADLDLAGRRKNGDEFPVEINLSPLQTTDGLYVSAIVRRRR